jgi:gamma-glutamylcyclotransferase (GGCT)/AIG2-like uncharacterized protein YtfP
MGLCKGGKCDKIADMKAGEELAVFVYGTLKPGERSWATHCAGRVAMMERAQVRGRLFDLRLAGYPAVLDEEGFAFRVSSFELKEGAGGTEDASGWVAGWRLVLKEAGALAGLDAWEGYQAGRAYSENDYNRVRRQCHTRGQAAAFSRAGESGESSREPGAEGAEIGEAWVYVMSAEKIAALGGVEVASGEWKG